MESYAGWQRNRLWTMCLMVAKFAGACWFAPGFIVSEEETHQPVHALHLPAVAHKSAAIVSTVVHRGDVEAGFTLYQYADLTLALDVGHGLRSRLTWYA